MTVNEWRVSRACDGGACVEVRADAGRTEVRDTTDRDGPVLAFTSDAWRAFTEGVRTS